jgi:hypothetical protein
MPIVKVQFQDSAVAGGPGRGGRGAGEAQESSGGSGADAAQSQMRGEKLEDLQEKPIMLLAPKEPGHVQEDLIKEVPPVLPQRKVESAG